MVPIPESQDMQVRVDSSAKVQPTEGKYLIHPGICLICFKTPDSMEEIFANPLIELEDYGGVFICLACCTEIGSFVRMVPRVEFDYMRATVAGLETSLREAHSQNEYLRGLLNARIDSGGYDESVRDVSASIPLFEVESVTDDIDSLINGIESEPAESGSNN
jgi:hypothetical protein